MTTADADVARERPWLVLLVAMLPLAAAWWEKAVVTPRPYWVVHYDPEVAYYLSGLNLLEGRPPIVVEHPGIPLQIVGAALAAATGHTHPLDVDGFRLPAYALGLLLTAGGAALLLRTVLRGLPGLAQIAIVWSAFAFPRALQFQTIWSPEMLCFSAAAVLLAAAWKFDQEPTDGRGVLAGAAAGLCLALKFTFAPLAAGSLVAVVWRAPRPRTAAAWCAGVAVAFVAGTAAAAARYGYAFEWLFDVVTHSGLYGRGAPTWPSLRAIGAHLASAFEQSKALCAAWTAAAVIVFVQALRRRRGPEGAALAALPFVALPLAYALTFRALEMRYVLPGAMAGIALLAQAGRMLPWRRLPIALPAAWGLAAALLLGHALGADLTDHTAVVAAGNRTRAAIDRLLAQAGAGSGDVTVYGWRAPEPAFALRVGAYARAHHLREIERAYPDAGDYEAWNPVVHLPEGRTRWTFAVLAARDVAGFPDPIGAVVGVVDGFVVVRAPARTDPPTPAAATTISRPNAQRVADVP